MIKYVTSHAANDLLSTILPNRVVNSPEKMGETCFCASKHPLDLQNQQVKLKHLHSAFPTNCGTRQLTVLKTKLSHKLRHLWLGSQSVCHNALGRCCALTGQLQDTSSDLSYLFSQALSS